MMMQPKAPKVFEDLDTNGNGTVSREQLQRVDEDAVLVDRDPTEIQARARASADHET